MTSSTGSRLLALSDGSQLVKYKMSWPVLACASAAIVSICLLPMLLILSIWTSTFSRAAHSSISALLVALAPGTQWSQMASDNLPAAYEPRTYGVATRVVEAAVVTRKRRRVSLRVSMACTPSGNEAQTRHWYWVIVATVE